MNKSTMTNALQRAAMRTAAMVECGRVMFATWTIRVEGLELQMNTDAGRQLIYIIEWDELAPMETDAERLSAVMMTMEDKTLTELEAAA